ncbi:hypothetical protein OHA40_14570 [Nocardia sp. NBC_00508]|uniref:hypothetical protein n=1 Tax=Nocardia sp. NBC_00508 TaxID=2975992 RepID=UPI002E7FBDC5|nr:hypothetical protein [Nocardia sp. NBC_00508]WUD69239.1 hypothetical protein OHA40_14570 [Nocardia sp. NBC_00508]
MPVSDPSESPTETTVDPAVPPADTGGDAGTGRAADPGSPADVEPAAGSGTVFIPSPEVEAVVARWNPQGLALLRALHGSGAATVVTVIGPADVNTTLLRTELARFEPRITLSEPMADPSAAVATTSPSDRGQPSVGALSGLALILLDAGTTIGADLLEAIGRLRADGTRILLAMNGIHAYRDWRAVRARNLELLAARGAADLDIVPVSARLAAAARTAGDAGLLDRSGLGSLHAQLTAAAAGAAAATGDRSAAVTGRVLADTRQRVVEQVGALRSGAELARLREERAVLLAGRDGGRATAMSTLRGQLHLARVDLMTDIGARIRALHTAARAELDRLRRADLRGYPDRLQQTVTELTGGVDRTIDHRLAELGGRIEGAERGMPSRRRDPAPRVGPDPEPRHRGVEDHLMIALGASAGVGLGRLLVAPLSLVPALDVASVPVTLALGGGAAAWVVRARGQLADRAHIRQWVSDALVNVKAQLEQRVATALVETETVLADLVVQASTARMVDTDRRVVELEAKLRRMAAEQPGQLAACERDIRILDRSISPVETNDQLGTQ